MQENISSFGNFFDEFHSFASEFSGAADVIVMSERGFLPTLVGLFKDTLAFIQTVLRNQEAASPCLSEIVCYTSTHVANFSVCHAYEFSVVRISLSNS